jgi:signal transduction histidine kinase
MDPQETRIYTVVIITSIILAVIIGYFIISIIRQQRKNLELQKKLILGEIEALEKERSRIAADLHDDLGPLLASIKFRIDYERGENEELAKSSLQLDGLIARIREIANNMMPSALHRKGLIAAVTEYLDNAELSGNMRIDFSYPETLSLPPDKSVHIYRAIQEIVHNCIKHANATEMLVKLTFQNGRLTILCRDNGKGFDPQKEPDNKGIGLKSLQNRTGMMGGFMMIESKKEVGTAILLEIPLK